MPVLHFLGKERMRGFFRFFKTPRITKIRVLLLSVIVIGLGLVFSQQSQALKDLLSRTARAVLGGSADIKLVPGTTAFQPGSTQTVYIQAHTHNVPVDGFQVIANIKGDLPSDLTFSAPTISGLNLLFDDLTIISPTEANLQLVYLTPLGTNDSYSNNAFTTIGQFTFTAPNPGTHFTVTYDTKLTKVLATETKENIVAFPNGQTVTYSVLSPTSTPTPTPTNTPSPTPTSTPTPTPSPTPTFTPTPTPTVTPKPSPTNSPTPTPTATPTGTPTPSPTPTGTPQVTISPTPTVKPSPGTLDPKIQLFKSKFQQLMEKLKQQTN